MPVRVGCSGWNYRAWRERVYPTGLPAHRWLEHYATLLDTVEVNSTFYRLAMPAAVANWLEQTPPGFVFAVKASRYLTHMKRLTDLEPGVRRFYDAVAPLAASPKLGPVLWQLPERMRADPGLLAAALAACRPGATASSSAIRAGSPTRCSSCCAGTGSRSSSPIIRRDRGSRWS